MRILFSADLHGNMEQYQRLFARALEPDIDAVVIGGDIAPKHHPADSFISAQRSFVRKEMKSAFATAKAKKPGLGIYLILGNDDARSLEKEVRAVCSETGAHYIHGERRHLDQDTEIIGYAHVPITPFSIKDWEKHDISWRDERIKELERLQLPGDRNRLDGVVSDIDAWRSHEIPSGSATEDSIQNDLAREEFTKGAKHTVYVVHTPPAITALDRIAYGHVGSVALRRFIETHQPLLTLHGHIHETVDITGKFLERIGTSVSISAGNHDHTRNVAAVIVDTLHPENAARYQL